ncbi:GAF and ANTAR domain-containing protein [Streptomyces sp. NPDC102278]|uniref:GAF and ANTAR domain-containing protein n=1 Tax=Streptomyces sp. NPDC102278 TaxID=3366152 RepID=UPI0037FBF128
MTTSREQQLTEAFVALSDTLGDDVDPLVLLGRLIHHSVALTPIDAAGVMLVNARGGLRSAITTEHATELTEVWQAQIRQGPCIEAFTTGMPVHAIDLDTQVDRWPDFVPVARAAGYHSAHALPLSLQGQNIGALNLLGRHPTPLTAQETHLLRAMADVATTAVLTWDRQTLRPQDVTTRTQAALSGKAVFDIASGMLAATVDSTPAEAGLQLHAYAARHHQRPTDVADRLVHRTLDPQAVLAPLSREA